MRLTISLLLLAVAPGFATFAASQERALPLFFIPNSGQADPAIRYLVQTPELRAGFAVDSAVFQVHETQIRVRFAGSNARVAIEGLHPMTARANFLIGDDPAAWHTGVPTYQGIIYRNLYPGIDMNYTGTNPRLKSEFLVAPGADPARILLEYSEAERRIAQLAWRLGGPRRNRRAARPSAHGIPGV